VQVDEGSEHAGGVGVGPVGAALLSLIGMIGKKGMRRSFHGGSRVM
jgi:hypothetical protein